MLADERNSSERDRVTYCSRKQSERGRQAENIVLEGDISVYLPVPLVWALCSGWFSSCQFNLIRIWPPCGGMHTVDRHFMLSLVFNWASEWATQWLDGIGFGCGMTDGVCWLVLAWNGCCPWALCCFSASVHKKEIMSGSGWSKGNGENRASEQMGHNQFEPFMAAVYPQMETFRGIMHHLNRYHHK